MINNKKNMFIKCECHSHGIEVEIDKFEDRPANTTFLFSIWSYGKKTKPSFKQR